LKLYTESVCACVLILQVLLDKLGLAPPIIEPSIAEKILVAKEKHLVSSHALTS
jgi:hypothetical protein